ncbi:tRNA uridine-5-carboxymethylaminomethyl(34) synthesis GTPase MnmE [Seohaeicola saemankumensis]|nr:tRNA uridine-5-carboxymethylaminomethyl(34) synthesis GTPase MnmE [Seohaeicola saemankumensis]MCA0870434.1 tRNA uridine-5-carboxymethylaminomethyl(34) synthesis GTPase MnmE [Seohaeicola saemankumensis]
MDTIFALASAPGKAGVAVIRISGPGSHLAVTRMTGKAANARGMQVRRLFGTDGTALDDAVVLYFSAPSSFTGEDVVELQVHGSTATVAAILNNLGKIDGLRTAEPGEFTRRALENGKLDLAQVEGLADLIDAETEAQRKQAHRLLEGALGDLAESWRKDLIRAASLIELVIDFADEEIPTDVTPDVLELLQRVEGGLVTQCSGQAMAERIRSGFEVAIVGPPNVGKSTLLNALAGRDAAITSEYAGTTRDVIEVRMDLGGLPVTLLDTAGLRVTDDVVEGMGIALARKRAEGADLRVFLADPDDDLEMDLREGDIRLAPKADLRGDAADAVSGRTGQGLDHLIQMIGEVLSQKSAGAGIASRDRHRMAMERALGHLKDARVLLDHGPDHYDLVADELRNAIRALESLVGRIDVETLLDEIFSSFCLGK